MNFIEVDSNFGKRVVDTDHIVFIRPPRENSEWYTLVFDIFDYDSEDRIEYFNIRCKSPSFDELMGELKKRASRTDDLLEKIYKTVVRRMK